MSVGERAILIVAGTGAAMAFAALAVMATPVITAVATVLALATEGPKAYQLVKEHWRDTRKGGPGAPASPSPAAADDPLGAPASGSQAKRPQILHGVVIGAALGTVIGLVMSGINDDESAMSDRRRTTTTNRSPSSITTLSTTTSTIVTTTATVTTTVTLPDSDTRPGDDETGSRHAAPLPGEDWNPEARAEFIHRCTTSTEPPPAGFDFDREQGCPCVYDYMSERVSFEDFNQGITGEDEMAAGYELLAAYISCST